MGFIPKKYKQLAYSTLFAILCITIFLAYRSTKLNFNYNFEDFFPKDDPEATYYKEFRKAYGSENDFLVLVIEQQPIFDTSFLAKVHDISQSIKALPSVTKVVSPTEAKQLIISPLGFMEVPLLHQHDQAALAIDSVKIFNSKEWRKLFFGENRKSLLLFINHEHQLSGNTAQQLTDSITSLLQDQALTHTFLAGRIVAEQVFVTKMRQELALFMSLSLLLLILFLWVAYRSMWGILVPVSAVLISLIWTCGIMELTGHKIDILTVVLPSILFIITISDITHFLSKYLEDLRAGSSKLHAFQNAYKEVGIATFITALTTAVGFITFLNAQMRPIQLFGLYAALGVFISYAVAFSYMPAIMLLLPTPKIANQNNHEHFWYLRLHKLLLWVFKNHKRILWGSLLICALSILGIFKIDINNTIIDDISKKDKLQIMFRYIDDNFGGVRPFEIDVIIPKDQPNLYDTNTFAKITMLHNYLEKTYGVNNLISPYSMVCMLNKASNAGNNAYYALPASKSMLQQQLMLLKKQQKSKELRNFIKDQGYRFRISGKVKDLGSRIFFDKNSQLLAFVDTLNLATGPKLQVYITGTAPLVDKNNLQIANDMILDLVIGILTIGLIIGFLFRNGKMAVLAIIPNLAPLLLIAAIMGVFHMNIKASNSIIFSIAFGIAIDDSIHFLSRFKEELSKGKSLFYAIKTTYLSTGKAMLITSLIVISGFCTMIASDFGGTFYMGLLVSLTLVFAIAFDFLLMPALLINFFRKKPEVVK